jgi:hypothetical protein
MSLITLEAQAEQTPEKVERLMRRTRPAGTCVDRVLVVYDDKRRAHIYYEGPPPKGPGDPA